MTDTAPAPTALANWQAGPDLTTQDNGRKALHAYVSDDAHDLWHGFGAHHGVSASALLEALAPFLEVDAYGRQLHSRADLAKVVQMARRVDAARRRRRR